MSSRDKWAQAAVVGGSLVHLTWPWEGSQAGEARLAPGSVSVSEGGGTSPREGRFAWLPWFFLS